MNMHLAPLGVFTPCFRALRSIALASIVLGLSACAAGDEGDANSADDFAARINGDAVTTPTPIDNNPKTTQPAGPVILPAPGTPAQSNAQPAQPGQTGKAPQTVPAPTVATPLPRSQPGANAAGSIGGVQSAACGADLVGDFLGQKADLATKAEINRVAKTASDVRFIDASVQSLRADPASARLNIMIDNLGVIRDARCG